MHSLVVACPFYDSPISENILKITVIEIYKVTDFKKIFEFTVLEFTTLFCVNFI